MSTTTTKSVTKWPMVMASGLAGAAGIMAILHPTTILKMPGTDEDCMSPQCRDKVRASRKKVTFSLAAVLYVLLGGLLIGWWALKHKSLAAMGVDSKGKMSGLFIVPALAVLIGFGTLGMGLAGNQEPDLSRQAWAAMALDIALLVAVLAYMGTMQKFIKMPAASTTGQGGSFSLATYGAL